jgi:hypothetical protein
MKRVAAVALIAMLFIPGVALAGSSTDAALGLGAFAVLNQLLSGTGIFGAFVPPAPAARPVVVEREVVVQPAPVVVQPAPVVVQPAPVVVAPPPPVYVVPAPVYAPAYVYVPARPVFVPPAHVRYWAHRRHWD